MNNQAAAVLAAAVFLVAPFAAVAREGMIAILLAATVGTMLCVGPSALIRGITTSAGARLAAVLLAWAGASMLWGSPAHTPVFARAAATAVCAMMFIAGTRLISPQRAERNVQYAALGGWLLLMFLLEESITRGFFSALLHPEEALNLEKLFTPPIMNIAAQGTVVLAALCFVFAAATYARTRSVLAAGVFVLVSLIACWRLPMNASTLAIAAGWIVFTLTYLRPRLGAGLVMGGLALYALLAPVLSATVLSAQGLGAPGYPAELILQQDIGIWQYTAGLVARHPLLGHGFNASQDIAALGELVPGKTWLAMPDHPHNGVLQIWLELGAVGIILACTALAFGWRQMRTLADRPLPAAVTAATVTTSAVIFLLSFSLWEPWWIATLGLAGGLGALATRVLPAKVDRAHWNAVSGELQQMLLTRMALTFAVVFAGLFIAGSFVRAPMLDELTTLYYTAPDWMGFLGRYGGDPHPMFYYLDIHIFSRFTDSIGWLRLLALTVPLAGLIAAGHYLYQRDAARAALKWLLPIGLPALFGSAVFLAYGNDLRTYGLLTISALLITTQLWRTAGQAPLTLPQRIAVVGTLLFMACCHFFGALLAFWLGLVALIANRRTLLRQPLRERAWDAVVIACAAAIGYLAYLYGPLVYGYDAGRWANLLRVGGLKTGLDTGLEYFTENISSDPVIVAILAAFYIVSLWAGWKHGEKRSFYFFDVPALLVPATAIVIASFVPVLHGYAFMPCISLLFAGMLIRLSREPHLHAAMLSVLFVNFVVHSPNLIQEPHAWGKTAAALQADMAASGTPQCPVFAIPDDRELFHTRKMLTGPVDLRPFGEMKAYCAKDPADICPSFWLIVNHISYLEANKVLELVPHTDNMQRWDRGLVARASCK